MKKCKSVNNYTDQEKHGIIQDYLTSGKSIKEIHVKYNLRGHSQIQDWMNKFGLRKKNKNTSEKKMVLKKEEITISSGEILPNRIKELEQQLEEEKLRTLLLNTMIDLAEDKLNIDIRKKSGAKQLKK